MYSSRKFFYFDLPRDFSTDGLEEFSALQKEELAAAMCDRRSVPDCAGGEYFRSCRRFYQGINRELTNS